MRDRVRFVHLRSDISAAQGTATPLRGRTNLTPIVIPLTGSH